MSNISGLNKCLQDIKRAASQRHAVAAIAMAAEEGAAEARTAFQLADYDGENRDVDVSVRAIKGGRSVVASGESVLFIEYGSGIRYGYGHPDPGVYGPGTWSESEKGHGHWDDPNGWFIPGTRQRSYGNPPAMAMYEAKKTILKRAIKEIVKI